jgi:hypothetical protein
LGFLIGEIMIIKFWQVITLWAVAGLISLGATVGFILLCIWLGAKIVKAVF